MRRGAGNLRTQEERRGGVPARVGGLCVGLALLVPLFAFAGEIPLDDQELRMSGQIMRLLPGVVGILADVSAEVQVRCGPAESHAVNVGPNRETATGFIIHPDGWIATNGHVVKPFYKDDEQQIRDFLRTAATSACGPALRKFPKKLRQARLDAILQDPQNRAGVRLTKKLRVFLPTEDPGPGFPAAVKAYSPPIDPARLPKDGSLPNPPMLDAALLKIEASNLPTVRLAPSIGHMVMGQQIVIVGYPGVVLWHDFLSKKSRAEASVTFGRVSAFRLDVNERTVLQTDAPMSWGDSGGPAFTSNGEIIGVATFISTSLEGDEAIQGFNFLIPIDTIQAMAKDLGVAPNTDSAFNGAWNQAIDLYMARRLSDAVPYAEAADKIIPGLVDVRRFLARVREFMREKP